jgi:AcrR family transcriptional regulator
MQSVDTGERATQGRSVANPSPGGSGQSTDGQPRERIVAAMIESVGKQGYACTTVADVIAGAGASRRTFYEQFADKQACFFVAADEVAAQWLERTASAVDRAIEGREDAIEAFVGELVEATLMSPSALRLLATELAAAGQPGIERRERVFTALSLTLLRALTAGAGDERESRDDGGLDGSPVPRALVGAIVRVLYTRVLRGGRVRRPRRTQLLALVPDIAHWTAMYRTAPAPVVTPASEPAAMGGRAPGTLSLSSRAEARRGLPRGEGAVSRSFVVHSQRERLLDAIANLSAAKGYGAVAIPEIVTEAAVSVQAFYEHFSSREDTLLVAYELGRRKALALVDHAYQGQPAWPAAVRAGLAALLRFLASEPSFAHLVLIDVPGGGGKLATLTPKGAVAEMLKPGLKLNPASEISEVTVEASAGAVWELCYMYTATERPRELPSLIDLATHIALTPFVVASPGAVDHR